MSENGFGRARNRTWYPPDPTPGLVREPAHWANLVTRKGLWSFPMYQNKEEGATVISWQKRHPKMIYSHIIRHFILLHAYHGILSFFNPYPQLLCSIYGGIRRWILLHRGCSMLHRVYIMLHRGDISLHRGRIMPHRARL